MTFYLLLLGKTVSSKKEELIHILDQFGIQVTLIFYVTVMELVVLQYVFYSHLISQVLNITIF